MAIAADHALARQIAQLDVPFGQLALWSLGQAGFIFKGGAALGVIDPYLADVQGANGVPLRRFPPPLTPTALTGVRLVLTTHEHADHTDPPTLAALLLASPRAELVTSPQGRALALAGGVPPDRIRLPRLGEHYSADGISYRAVPAAHMESETDGAGHARWMGFVIECNGVRVYHAGDTILTPTVAEALADLAPDLALLPINGRDVYREQQGIVGNLWPVEAVQLARQIGARVLIGMHNDLFAENRVPPGALFAAQEQHAPWLRCHLLQPGELYLYAG